MSTPGAGRGAAGRQVNFQTVPKGEVLGTYDTYLEAQERVDHLAKADFPVGKVSIVGNDLKSVERVTRKLSWSRAALEGALSGAWFGLFIGVVLTFFSPTHQLGLLPRRDPDRRRVRACCSAWSSYGICRRSRDFESTNQVLASNYQVIVDPELLDRAKEALARPKAGLALAPAGLRAGTSSPTRPARPRGSAGTSRAPTIRSLPSSVPSQERPDGLDDRRERLVLGDPAQPRRHGVHRHERARQVGQEQQDEAVAAGRLGPDAARPIAANR